MKKLLFSLFTFVALSFCVSSCDDDDDDDDGVGEFTLEGETYDLDKAFAGLEEETPVGDNTYYTWHIAVVSDDITWNESSKEFSGTGDGIGFWIMVANDAEFLPEGTYEYVMETADSDGVYIDYNFTNETGEVYDDLENVSLRITKSGNTFTFEFTLLLANEEVVTGQFTGLVTEVTV